MAKVKRSVLKQLIKECLVEILVEGLSSESGVDALVEAARPRRPSKNESSQQYEAEVARLERQRQALDSRKVNKQAVSDSVISSMTTDATMADIFRDTASTTLLEQGMKNQAGPRAAVTRHDSAAAAVAENNLEDLFSGSNNWAQLAFSNSDNNK